MSIAIRRIEGQEMLDTLFPLHQYAFHPTPPFTGKEDWEGLVRERKGVTCFAAFENDKPVASAASTAMVQNMRGELYPACGIWGVATAPGARRKGCCRQVMASVLTAEHGTGKVFSNLYPFSEPFYERMGYVSYPLMKIARFTPEALAPLLELDLQGEIELKLIGDAFEEYRAYLAEMQASRHGMAVFAVGDKAAADRNRFWLAQAKFDGKTEGLMMYHLQGEEVTKFNFQAGRFYYRSSRARYLMLNWIARHVDQADRVEIWLTEDEYPELWLADLQVKVEVPVRPAMSRVLDVEKIGGMSAGEGSFTAALLDSLCPWNEGIWRFESSAGKLQVSRASKADCELTIQAVSALVAGTRDPQDFSFMGWGNPDRATQSLLRAMFPAARPYMHENF